jgi:hypothetical protein
VEGCTIGSFCTVCWCQKRFLDNLLTAEAGSTDQQAGATLTKNCSCWCYFLQKWSCSTIFSNFVLSTQL